MGGLGRTGGTARVLPFAGLSVSATLWAATSVATQQHVQLSRTGRRQRKRNTLTVGDGGTGRGGPSRPHSARIRVTSSGRVAGCQSAPCFLPSCPPRLYRLVLKLPPERTIERCITGVNEHAASSGSCRDAHKTASVSILKASIHYANSQVAGDCITSVCRAGWRHAGAIRLL